MGTFIKIEPPRCIAHLSDDPDPADSSVITSASPGCFRLRVLSIRDVEKVSLQTITVLLLNLPELAVLEHNLLHEAVSIMHKTGASKQLGLTGYNG